MSSSDEHEYDGGAVEELGVAYLREERDALVHAIHLLRLRESLIVLRETRDEEYGGDILECVEPPPALVATTADVDSAERRVGHAEVTLDHAAGASANVKHV